MAEIVVSSLNLGDRGKRLFRDMRTSYPSMDPIQTELLIEACRIADQLETLHNLLRGDKSEWMFIRMPRNAGNLVLEIDSALTQSRQLQLALKTITAQLTVAGEAAGNSQGGAINDIAARAEQRRLEARRGPAGNATA